MNQAKVKGIITILFLMIFTSTLSLDVYAKTTFEVAISYELMDTEEEQDTEEEDSKEEFKKDEYLSFYTRICFSSSLVDIQFADNQHNWKLDIQDILLPPPKS